MTRDPAISVSGECICNAGFGMNLSCPLHGVTAPRTQTGELPPEIEQAIERFAVAASAYGSSKMKCDPVKTSIIAESMREWRRELGAAILSALPSESQPEEQRVIPEVEAARIEERDRIAAMLCDMDLGPIMVDSMGKTVSAHDVQELVRFTLFMVANKLSPKTAALSAYAWPDGPNAKVSSVSPSVPKEDK